MSGLLRGLMARPRPSLASSCLVGSRTRGLIPIPSARATSSCYSTGSTWPSWLIDPSIAKPNLRRRLSSQSVSDCVAPGVIRVQDRDFPTDDWTNVTPWLFDRLGRRLHLQEGHPLSLIRRRIVRFMYGRYRSYRGNPLFSVHDRLSPIVTLAQNYDSLLVPPDHPSRKPSDSYYLNREWMLRAHTSAHQIELIQMGLDNFLVVGDVYRRDEIDASHYPVFHQVEGVRLLDQAGLNARWAGSRGDTPIQLFESGSETRDKQAVHTVDATQLLEWELKDCLLGLVRNLFGPDIKYRWVDAYFPFTHPSWELEIQFKGEWMEMLGCGIMRQELLHNGGVPEKIGWAFGLGLERLAMKLYEIPDIRIFWSQDSGVLSQFQTNDIDQVIKFKAVSKYPQCKNDISFWLPQTETEFCSNDFYDLVRSIGKDLVEQVVLVDSFYHEKKQKHSHCYRIVYRSMEKTLTQAEANEIHKQIEKQAASQLKVEIR